MVTTMKVIFSDVLNWQLSMKLKFWSMIESRCVFIMMEVFCRLLAMSSPMISCVLLCPAVGGCSWLSESGMHVLSVRCQTFVPDGYLLTMTLWPQETVLSDLCLLARQSLLFGAWSAPLGQCQVFLHLPYMSLDSCHHDTGFWHDCI